MTCENKGCGKEGCGSCATTEEAKIGATEGWPFAAQEDDGAETEGFEGTPLAYADGGLDYPLAHAFDEFLETLKLKVEGASQIKLDMYPILQLAFMSGASNALKISQHGIEGMLDVGDSVAYDKDALLDGNLLPVSRSYSVMELIEEAHEYIYPEDEEGDEDLDEEESDGGEDEDIDKV